MNTRSDLSLNSNVTYPLLNQLLTWFSNQATVLAILAIATVGLFLFTSDSIGFPNPISPYSNWKPRLVGGGSGIPLLRAWAQFPKQVNAKYHPVEIKLYKENGTEYNQLYISRPTSDQPGPTVIWFHGGGLTGDGNGCPPKLYNGKNTVVEVRYPVYPKVSTLTIVEDSALAVAWCFKHIDELGGNASQIFVAGMSAGGYLTAIIGMKPSLLATHGIDNRKIADLIPVSGQMTAHFKIKEEFKLPKYVPVVDDNAPMNFISKDLPPILLLTGESGLDMAARPEENALLAASLRAAGHPDVSFYSLAGHSHGGIYASCEHLMLRFIDRIVKAQEEK